MEHITTLSFCIKPVKDPNFSENNICAFGPMLQSVLLSHADSSYAEQLHTASFHPYSQCCFKDRDGNIIWRINALTDEATSYLLEPARKIESFTLRNLDTSFAVVKSSYETSSISCLLDRLTEETDPTFRIQFLTSTAFKSKGRYVIIPEVRLIFQNLLMRYNQVYAGSNEIDANTVAYIADHTSISSYNLRSRYFSRTMSKSDKIPAFVGSATLHVAGSQQLRGLIAMLLAFGEVAGVGIKTSMGMGGLRLLQNTVKTKEQNREG